MFFSDYINEFKQRTNVVFLKNTMYILNSSMNRYKTQTMDKS